MKLKHKKISELELNYKQIEDIQNHINDKINALNLCDVPDNIIEQGYEY